MQTTTSRADISSMDYVSIFLAGLALGIFACALVCVLIAAFRPTPPTMYGRRRAVQWELPAQTVEPVRAEAEQGGIEYRFLGGVTGEEQA